MAKKKRVSKKTTKKVQSLKDVDLKFIPDMTDRIIPLAISWRDQKTLTALADDGCVYIYMQTSKKWIKFSERFEI